MPSAKISFLSAIFKIPYLRLFVCVLVSLGTKSINASFIPAPIAGPNRREEPDVLQKLILLYPTFAKNASPFLVFFLKKVVSRSVSTTKSSIFFPIFRLTSRSNRAHGPFSRPKNVQNAPKTQLKPFSDPSSFKLEQAQITSNDLIQARTVSNKLISAHLSSSKLKPTQLSSKIVRLSSDQAQQIKSSLIRAHPSTSKLEPTVPYAQITCPSDGSCRA